MMRELVWATPEVVEYMRSLPAWQARVAAAHTIPRELRAEDAYRFDPGRFKELKVPTLLLRACFKTASLAAGMAKANLRSSYR